jgi:hypothetical protein
MNLAALRFLFYELAVTNAHALALFMASVRRADVSPSASGPSTLREVVLREDFAGTAALARAWTRLSPRFRAVAIDRSRDVTRHIPAGPRLRVRSRDVFACTDRCDILAATNFPVCYSHTRKDLLRYLRHARACLNKDGVFVCDLYGGEGCWSPITQRRRVAVPKEWLGQPLRATPAHKSTIPASFIYEWQQLAADQRTGLVHNAIHLSWKTASRPRRIANAFEYHWRLWSIPELTDALHEAGFQTVDVYDHLADAMDIEGNVYVEPMARGQSPDATYVVYLVAR